MTRGGHSQSVFTTTLCLIYNKEKEGKKNSVKPVKSSFKAIKIKQQRNKNPKTDTDTDKTWVKTLPLNNWSSLNSVCVCGKIKDGSLNIFIVRITSQLQTHYNSSTYGIIDGLGPQNRWVLWGLFLREFLIWYSWPLLTVLAGKVLVLGDPRWSGKTLGGLPVTLTDKHLTFVVVVWRGVRREQSVITKRANNKHHYRNWRRVSIWI